MTPEEMDETLSELDGRTASDYKREAYGDPCPKCGCLRWQGDCPNCTPEED